MACECCDDDAPSSVKLSDLRRLYDLVAEQRTLEALTMMHEAAPGELPLPVTILRLRQPDVVGTDL
ncbi:hypothetical protein NS365_04700 [Aureimonas ureilytica]|uniref:Uncharacterized protein n=1 Tax=Aureimonas ureilytica TaxID=401562 RepID=A0A175RUF9_9HYPH|nr:hypothetical protein NS365_04700 [Aureimonas ureilytica]